MNITTSILLLLLYSTLPPLLLFYTLKLIYHDKKWYGIHLMYIFKYLITLSFLPLMFFKNLQLGIVPVSYVSVAIIILTLLLTFAGFARAIKQKNLFFYNAGITAGFMEEILYRSVIFSLALDIWNNQWVALGVSSLLFGLWHLKNYYWVGKKDAIKSMFYTALFYGPVFGLVRIWTGDIYLSILLHYLTDATCALAPAWMRGWLVREGMGGKYDDKAAGI